jgi:hypothetical protein
MQPVVSIEMLPAMKEWCEFFECAGLYFLAEERERLPVYTFDVRTVYPLEFIGTGH